MSQFQSIFKRYEKKYILTSRQKQKILETAKPYLARINIFIALFAVYIMIPRQG